MFLVRRHDAIAFMGGAHVFPGGRVDPSDAAPEVAALCDGIEGVLDRMAGVTTDQGRAFYVAGVRELFEEAGVLLARDEEGSPVGARPDDAARLERCRSELAGGARLGDIARRERWRLAFDWLTLFAHWVTPAIEIKRFDTRFFLAVAPDRQEASHCGQETTLGTWLRPADALAKSLAGEIALPPPTWTTLRWLERFQSIDDAVAWARGSAVPRIEPGFELDGDTRIVTLPVAGFEGQETRFALKDGRWRPLVGRV